MSEPPPRGAERDLFRDTWVRYLGERGAGGQRPLHHVSGEAGVARRRSGTWRRWEDLNSHLAREETGLREGSELAQGHTALVFPALPSGFLLVRLPGGSRSSGRRMEPGDQIAFCGMPGTGLWSQGIWTLILAPPWL